MGPTVPDRECGDESGGGGGNMKGNANRPQSCRKREYKERENLQGPSSWSPNRKGSRSEPGTEGDGGGSSWK